MLLLQYKEKKDESGLHIIIFDELDAIFKQRGSTNNGTGVGDTVVNQLLSKVRAVVHYLADKRSTLYLSDGWCRSTEQYFDHRHD